MHAVAPDSTVPVPAPISATDPDAQTTQSDASSLPVTSTYFPAPQPMQSDASSLPVTSTYFPAPQSSQSVALSLPAASTYFPAAQPVQASLPVAFAYRPAAQSAQSAVELEENWPTAHSVQDVAAAQGPADPGHPAGLDANATRSLFDDPQRGEVLEARAHEARGHVVDAPKLGTGEALVDRQGGEREQVGRVRAVDQRHPEGVSDADGEHPPLTLVPAKTPDELTQRRRRVPPH